MAIVSTLPPGEPGSDQRQPADPFAATAGRSRGSILRRAGRILLPVAFIVLLVWAWQIWVDVARIHQFLLPAPSAIWHELTISWSSVLAHDTWVTLQEILYGFVAGCAIGFLLAVGIAYSRFLERALYPLIVASQAVPKIAIAPLFIVWLGFGIAPKIVVTILLVFFPVTMTSAQGLMSVDESLVELLRSVEAGPWQVFARIRFPNALPQIFSGLRIGITLAVVGAVVGEWVGAHAGLGYLITYAQSQLETTLTFASIAILVVMGVALFLIVDVLAWLAVPWARNQRQQVNATY
ncbi:MAG: ABC transporter permease [Acidimicrobiales bacterium]